MAINTSQQISHYYDAYSDREITFTKEVIKATRLDPKHVHLKCLGYQWPCIVYSSSMQQAKIIVNMKDSLKAAIHKAKNLVSLRFSFIQADKPDPVAFFVTARISAFTPYNKDDRNLSFLSLTFTQRPPDGLIEVLGSILEAHHNSKQRSDERIQLNTEAAAELGFLTKGVQIFVQGVPRKCILRDVSFGGAKVIIMGVPKFLLNKEAVLRLPVADSSGPIEIEGQVIRFEQVEGRDDIAAFAIKFNADRIPMKYKLRLSEYMNLESSPKVRAAERARKQNQAIASQKEEAARKVREARQSGKQHRDEENAPGTD